MDLEAANRPPRDQIGSIAHTWQTWQCPCGGCTKARRNERQLIIKYLEERLISCDTSDEVFLLTDIIENLQNPPKNN